MTTPAPTDRHNPLVPLLLAVAILFVVGRAVFFGVRWVAGPSRPESAGRRVQVGMTLGEVEAILGPGTLLNYVPEHPDGPVVRGDAFYRWTATELWGEAPVIYVPAIEKWRPDATPDRHGGLAVRICATFGVRQLVAATSNQRVSRHRPRTRRPN